MAMASACVGKAEMQVWQALSRTNGCDLTARDIEQSTGLTEEQVVVSLRKLETTGHVRVAGCRPDG